MKRQAALVIGLVACMSSGCASTTQSQEASAPEPKPEKTYTLADRILDPEAPPPEVKGPGVPCEKNFDKETCASLRGVKTNGP